MSAIEVQELRKSYGSNEAVKGVSFTVEAGEVFAFLGPNGAGKTTTLEILEGFRRRTSGEVSVLGLDPAEAGSALRKRIGIVLQGAVVEPYLTVREVVQRNAGYYPSPRPVDEVIDQVGLRDKARARVRTLSGGQQRRLDVALGLIGAPELLFLDEPTTGFDPMARRRAWEVIASLRDLGKTIFLTTHYMEEAQELADQVAIIAGGRIVAQGTPRDLSSRDGRVSRISFRLPPGIAADQLPGALAAGASASPGTMDELQIQAQDPVRTLNELTGWALERGVELAGLEVRQPSLEDVYLELTRPAPEEARRQ